MTRTDAAGQMLLCFRPIASLKKIVVPQTARAQSASGPIDVLPEATLYSLRIVTFVMVRHLAMLADSGPHDSLSTASAVWGLRSPLWLQAPKGDVDARHAAQRVRFAALCLRHLDPIQTAIRARRLKECG